MLTGNLKFRNKNNLSFFSFFAMFDIKITNDSHSRSKYLRAPFAENKHVPIKHKQMSFVSNGGKFKLYTVLNSLLFSTPTPPRISFDCMILHIRVVFTTEI
jgi:hypothetical protein